MFSMKDLPLHSSQRLVEEGEGYIDYEIRPRPTSDFIAKLLSRGEWLVVMKPETIAEKVVGVNQKAIDRYKKMKIFRSN